jgi:hypothetical protein
MKYARLLTLCLVSILATIIPALVLAAPLASDSQARACLNAVVFKLNGIPRSTVTVSAGSLESDGTALVNWSTQTGGSGFCWVDQTNKVTQVQVEVEVGITQEPRPLSRTIVAGAEMIVTTDGGAMNIRSSPGGEIVGSAANGSTLVVTGRTSGEWVEINGGGWVSQYLLSKSDRPVDPQETDPQGTRESVRTDRTTPALETALQQSISSKTARVVTDGGGVNVRNSPGGDVISSFPDGSLVNLTGQTSNGWVEIEGGGWISEVYLRTGN